MNSLTAVEVFPLNLFGEPSGVSRRVKVEMTRFSSVTRRLTPLGSPSRFRRRRNIHLRD
jgi:hypothetical protein